MKIFSLSRSCFDEKNKELIKQQKPTKGFLNPPYQDGNADEQLEFIENTLECLVKDGTCIAICQMSTVVSEDKKVIEVRKRLLEKHTLDAVFSMPDDLFNPVTVNTCILVFKAHNPHSQNKKTFFGYFKNDGFVKTKNNGRTDKDNKFKNIKKVWLEKYFNRENYAGLSVTKVVSSENEWCAEAYMETDYSKLQEEDFIINIRNYVGFMFSSGKIELAESKPYKKEKGFFDLTKWRNFSLSQLFDMKAGKYYPTNSYENGETPLISASENNNGVKEWTDLPCKYKNCLTIGKIGISTFYQSIPFIATADVTILIPKEILLNQYIGLFIATILNKEKYKWSFGRQIRLNDCRKLEIKLPSNLQGKPDLDFMESYIKSLPYSSSL